MIRSNRVKLRSQSPPRTQTLLDRFPDHLGRWLKLESLKLDHLTHRCYPPITHHPTLGNQSVTHQKTIDRPEHILVLIPLGIPRCTRPSIDLELLDQRVPWDHTQLLIAYHHMQLLAKYCLGHRSR